MKHSTFSLFLMFILSVIAGCASAPEVKPQPEPLSKEELRKFVKENPAVILDILKENNYELLNRLQRQREIEYQLKNPLEPEIDPDRMIFGKPDAPVTIVGYSDFQCPFCKKAAGTIEKLLEKYPEKLRFVFKHCPRDTLSMELALYFEAIGRQSRESAWQFHHDVFGKQKEIAASKNDVLKSILDSLGIDRKRLERDMADNSLKQQIKADQKEAGRFRFESIPSFIINGVFIHGTESIEEFENLIRMVEKARRK